jgi:hypothetical protein
MGIMAQYLLEVFELVSCLNFNIVFGYLYKCKSQFYRYYCVALLLQEHLQ